MEKNLSYFSLILMCANLIACSTGLTVKSEPADADVYIQAKDSESKTVIGKTPLTITEAELQEKAKVDPSASDYYVLTVEKKGYAPEKLLVPPTRLGHIETVVSAKLTESGNSSLITNKLLGHLFNAQKFANLAQFERAQSEIDKALEIEPKFARAMSLRGSIYFVQKNYNESLTWFEKALTAEPNFEEAVKMIAQIKKIQGASQ